MAARARSSISLLTGRVEIFTIKLGRISISSEETISSGNDDSRNLENICDRYVELAGITGDNINGCWRPPSDAAFAS
ncbi:hypothetical protein VI817_001869 [Penicillium citrinum]|nr:hypothetical protein VI817_001869 [Penicillium citrinum]